MSKNPISKLQEFAVTQKLSMPDYDIIGIGTAQSPKFLCRLKYSNRTVEVTGISKKDAKFLAAQNMLILLTANKSGTSNDTIYRDVSSNYIAEVNYVGKVNEFANHYRQRQPCYSDEAPINGTFVIQCTFMNNNTFGYGKTKKAAKQHSAELMWKKLQEDDSRCYEEPGKNKSNGLSTAQDLKTDEIIRAIEGLTLEHMQPHKVNVKIEVTQSPVTNSKRLKTIQELKTDLYLMNFDYEISTFRPRPLILLLKANNGIILLGTGSTYEEAEHSVLSTAVEIAKHKVDLISL
ncbi:uncharacterized protein LOC109602504 [Aethina tumida]|uniref:uncharacterized protein LOC109602504 n=1 Tax=Aethina tumida TaxID=116153 RepID=UPI0021476BD6|nr:uncharacterized protein LOC109602504 [Aethina tumida]